MGFRTVCIENKCKCSYAGGYLVVTGERDTTKIHLSEISSLMFCTTRVYLSAYLVSELAKYKIPVIFCDEKSYPVAESLPLYGAHNCHVRVSSQLDWTLPAKKRLWQRIVQDKIAGQAQVLGFAGHANAAEGLLAYAREVRSGDPTNREAAAAKLYFAALFGDGFNRDLDTPENAALNYGYSVLLSHVSREIVSRGYLTQIGINHRGPSNQWNFSCDLMEPFRPFVDSIVVRSGLDAFDTAYKRLLADMMNRALSYKDGVYKAGSVVSLYIRECLDALEKKISVDEIAPFFLT